jgi:hypothetical protein
MINAYRNVIMYHSILQPFNRLLKLYLFTLLLLSAAPVSAQIVKWNGGSMSGNTLTVYFSFSPNAVADTLHSISVSSLPTATISSGISFDNNDQLRASFYHNSSNGYFGKYYLHNFRFNIHGFTPGQKYTGRCAFSFNNLTIQNNIVVSIRSNCILFDMKTAQGLGKQSESIVPFDIPSDRCINIEVMEDGIYKLTGKQLRISGVPLNTIPAENYRLFFKDREIPIYISDDAGKFLSDKDYILFHGRRLYGEVNFFEQFSLTSHYRLFWGSKRGLRVSRVSGDRRKDPTVYSTGKTLKADVSIDSIHIEEDNAIRWLGNISDIPPEEITGSAESNDNIDNWYWTLIGDKDLTSCSFTIPSPSQNGTARLRINLMGLTSVDSVAPDHLFDCFLNGNPIGNHSVASWDGQRSFIFESDTFSSSSLIHGTNEVSFVTRNTGFTDRATLNWIECIYPYSYEALGGQTTFKSSPKTDCSLVEYEIKGFTTSDIEIWDTDRGRFFTNCIINAGSGKKRGTFALIFQDSICNGAHYTAQEIQLRKIPKMYLDTLTFKESLFKNADYIVIAPDSFNQELQPLIDLHNSGNIKTVFVSIETIYHYFAYGIHDPDAIRTFIKYCFQSNPDHPPLYVLLAGDTSHDLDKANRELNLVPTHLSRMEGWGPGANDDYFVSVQGNDQFPDLCIGRFPARTIRELKCLVEKTCNYISSPQRGYWKDNILLLGGGEKVFTQFNDMVSDEVIGSSMNILRMDAEPSSRYYKDASIAPEMIANAINSGVFFVNFNGHGGGNIWSDNNFFGYRDLSRLLNGTGNKGGRLPVIFSFTCLTGFFESVYYRSLGEEFLRNSSSGTIAFYGASAYTSSNGNRILNRLTLENALNHQFQTLGELIRYSELSMLTNFDAQYLNLVNQYNILGDPALPLLYPDTSLQLTVRKSLLKGNDSLEINGRSSTIHSGNIRLLVSSGGDEWFTRFTRTNSGSFSETFPVKSEAHSANGTIRAYMWNDSSESRAVASFSKDTINISDISIFPSLPHYGDSVLIRCSVMADSVSQIMCLYSQFSPSENPKFTMSPMTAVPTGSWQSADKIPVLFRESFTDDQLGILFRIITEAETRESRLFTFKIAGCPDLAFTTKKLSLHWKDDSLRTSFQIINKGNVPDAMFSIVLVGGENNETFDTIRNIEFTGNLGPAATASVTFSIPDTFKTLNYAVILVSKNRENTTANNRIEGKTVICKKLLLAETDTLFSDGRGIAIHPLYSLINPVTAFLLTDSIPEIQPLKSTSCWLRLQYDSIASVSIGCRPSLTPGDTLQWLFYPSLSSEAATRSGAHSVLHFDSALSRWHSVGQKVPPSQQVITHNTTGTGPFSAGYISDLSSPDVHINVFGRTLDFVDYAAKDKPFSVFISDPSELYPSSIMLFHNNRKLADEKYSQIPSSGDLEHISITAYPPKESSLDSLTVRAMDLAGNLTERTFAYLPGKNLSIQFFSCHPNPFTAATRQDGTLTTIRFAYMLTDAANDIQLTLYTVTGRPIRTWKFNNLIGYQEIPWDGRDRDGYRIANGTYYAKLTVKNRTRKLKKIIKIAKLEGY